MLIRDRAAGAGWEALGGVGKLEQASSLKQPAWSAWRPPPPWARRRS